MGSSRSPIVLARQPIRETANPHQYFLGASGGGPGGRPGGGPGGRPGGGPGGGPGGIEFCVIT